MPEGCWMLFNVRPHDRVGSDGGSRPARGSSAADDRPNGPRRGGQGGGRPRARRPRYTVVGGGCLAAGVTTWQEFSEQAPELAARVFERFEAHRHKTMATIRADGGPRICGTEAPIKLGEVWLGGMTGNRRFADLRRDPRVVIHSASEDPDVWTSDAKIAG